MKVPTPLLPFKPVMRGLVIAYGVSGTIHLVRPQVFEAIIPRELPRRRELVYASGVTELMCAAGLLTPKTRRIAAVGSAAMLVSFLPAHAEMTRQAYERMDRKGATPARQAYLAGTVLRIIGQFPMIRASIDVARGL